ncbi:MBL fold metallo-hydrolase [Paenibacillus sp. P25]|nr:MBL fold metallo-hydrolase [Paenibacillus sp. P25]
MKAERVSEHIWSLKLWMVIPIHVWVVVEEGGVTLVDTGIPVMAKGILKFIERLQAGSLQRIVLTHGHPDHAGGIKPIITTNPVPVYAHPIELPYLEGEIPYSSRKKASATLEKGTARALQEDGNGTLLPIGRLAPYHTPGHSPGHVVYYHEKDQVLLAGDLFSSKGGKLRRPLFTPDMRETLQSSMIIGRLKPARLEVCHGGPVINAAEQLEEYVEKMSKTIRNGITTV